MRPVLPIFCVTLALAGTASAQDTTAKPRPAAKSDSTKTVMMSGCLAGGSSSYTLSNVTAAYVAHDKTAEVPVGTSGTASTSYGLTARDGIDLSTHLGHKVEITGVMLPATAGGAAAPTTVAHPSAKEEPKTRTDATRGAYPKIAVTSVRMLSVTCQ